MMMTIGNERFGLRITKGRMGRNGKFHPFQPCVFWLVNGKRIDRLLPWGSVR